MPMSQRRFADAEQVSNGNSISSNNEEVAHLPHHADTYRRGISVRPIEGCSTIQQKTNGSPQSIMASLRAHYEQGNLFGDLVDFLVDMVVAGFTIEAYPTATSLIDDSDENTIETWLDIHNQARRLFRMNPEVSLPSIDLQSIVSSLVRDWIICDAVVLYWRVGSHAILPGTNLEEVSSIPPETVEWKVTPGDDQLTVTIPEATLRILQEAARLQSPIREEFLESNGITSVNDKWLQAAKKGNKVTLRREDGDRWAVLSKSIRNGSFGYPGGKRILPDLMQAAMLRDGDFAAAYIAKKFYEHVTMGETAPAASGSMPRSTWATDAEIKEMDAKLNNPSAASRVVTQHHVKFQYVFPPKEMWNREKFASFEQALFDWSSISEALFRSKGSTYASGFIGLKRTMTRVQSVRSPVARVLAMFLSDGDCTFPWKETIYQMECAFDQQSMKEPRQVMEEQKFLNQHDMEDPFQTWQLLGMNPWRTIQRRKLCFMIQTRTKVFGPIAPETDETDENGEAQGRPANPETTLSENTRQQPPSSGEA